MNLKRISNHIKEHKVLGVDKKIRQAMFKSDGGGVAGGVGVEVDPIFTAWLAGPPNVSVFTNDAGYLTVETDPIVGAINGLVKADGGGNIAVAVADTDYLLPATGNLRYPLRTEWLQNGFPNRTASSLAWSDANRRLTINPTGVSFDYFVQGVKYTVATSDVVNVNYVDIADTEGLHIFYYDGAVLTTIANPTDAQIETATLTKCLVAYVYWDADNNLGELIEERHGLSISPYSHRLHHFTEGTMYFDGLALGDFVISDGTDDEDAQFSVATGQIFDEDIKFTTNAIGKLTGLEVWYRNVALDWRKDTQAGFSVLNAGGGRVYYDNAGTLTEVTDGNWVLYHIFATSNADLNPISIMGQAQYAKLKDARIGATTEINSLLLGALPSKEMKAIATVIFQTDDGYGNAVKARVVQTDEGDDYVDWRTAPLSPSAPAQDHGSLAGLADDDHSQYHNDTRGDLRYQPLDATLTSIALLGTAADKGLYTTDVDTWAEFDLTAAGRALLDDANAAAQIATLGLDADIATLALPANTTISAFGASIIDDAAAANVIATLGLDADIATLSLPASTTITAAAQTILDDANVGAIRTTLGVGTGDSPTLAALTLSGNLGFSNNSGAYIVETGTGFIAITSSGSYVYLQSAVNNHMYFDAGGYFYFRDRDASLVPRITFDSSTGSIAAEGGMRIGAATGIPATANYYSADGSQGWTGTFLDLYEATITVKNGIITNRS